MDYFGESFWLCDRLTGKEFSCFAPDPTATATELSSQVHSVALRHIPHSHGTDLTDCLSRSCASVSVYIGFPSRVARRSLPLSLYPVFRMASIIS